MILFVNLLMSCLNTLAENGGGGRGDAASLRYNGFIPLLILLSFPYSCVKPGSQYIACDAVRPEVIIFSMGFAASRH